MTLFSQKAYTKCILTGEHSVMRGADALVLPCFSFYTQFDYTQNDKSIEVFEKGFATQEENAFLTALLHRLYPSLKGTLEIRKNLSQGTGLGGSAALSILLSKLLNFNKLIKEEDVLSTAIDFENIFHGGSTSGVDVYSVFYEKPMLFNKSTTPYFLNSSQDFALYLFPLTTPSNSKKDIAQVAEFFKNYPSQGSLLDETMQKSTQIALKAYEQCNLLLLANALDLTKECFEKWGLIQKEAKKSCDLLKELGALSVKPTGSGGGGYLLSLWSDHETALKASQKLPFSLIGLGAQTTSF
ncbi:MAG TPA: hypothetical protein VI959_04505 [Alphaproteobacteria bacterium]|nr:hypothetical protein [Alphaproteobacteria bacterium]